MQGMLILALLAVGSFAIAIYSVQPRDSTIALPDTPQTAALALTPVPVPVSIDGTIVIGQTTAHAAAPYVRYVDGDAVKTKRLAFADRHGCTAGELPCASPVDTSYPFAGGERVHVEGTADADVIYVSRMTVDGRATLRSYDMEAP